MGKCGFFIQGLHNSASVVTRSHGLHRSCFRVDTSSRSSNSESCVQMGMAGQAGDPNRMCIKAVSCSSTDGADCKCSLHGGCGMSSASGAQSCIHKPVLDKDKACFDANTNGASPVASAGSPSTPS